jgi:hypothetical protein
MTAALFLACFVCTSVSVQATYQVDPWSSLSSKGRQQKNALFVERALPKCLPTFTQQQQLLPPKLRLLQLDSTATDLPVLSEKDLCDYSKDVQLYENDICTCEKGIDEMSFSPCIEFENRLLHFV